MRLRSINLSLLLAICALMSCGCAHRTVRVGTKIENGQLRIADKMIFHVKEGKRNYDVLVGVDTTKGGTFARAEVRHSETYVILFSGFMYLFGEYPVGGTQNVAAAAQGTTMVIELLADRERVYLLDVDGDETVTASLAPGRVPAPGSKTSYVLNEHQYVECIYAAGGTLQLVAPQAIPAAGQIMDFLNYAKTQVDAAGVGGWPTPWP